MLKPTKFSFKKAKITGARAGSLVLESFHMREIDGRDEELAAGMAAAKGGHATGSEEMVRLAIVAVNDKPVQQPYLAFDVWNQRARSFALRAFRLLNSHTEKESDDFLATAEEASPTMEGVPTEPAGPSTSD